MPYIIDGDWSGNNKLKKRTSNFIQAIPKTLTIKKLQAFSYGKAQNIDEIIERAFVSLVYIADIDAYSKIELAKQKNSTIPGNLSYLEVINKCYFFISMLGFIDKAIMDCNDTMQFNERFIDTDEYAAERYYSASKLLTKLSVDRDKVIFGLQQTDILKKYDSSLPIIFDECLKKVPAFESFGELYSGASNIKDDRALKIIQKFTNAYNDGYNASSTNYVSAIDNYYDLYNKLHSHIIEDRKKVHAYTKK